jgi:hypothetical protein
MTLSPPCAALLLLDGYAGASLQRVLVIGETPQRWRIRAVERTKLAGRGRWLEPGGEALVPKHAIRLTGGPL